MSRQYSIAEARNQLPGIVHDVEANGAVEITRRGKPVAMIISMEEYRRLTGPKLDSWESIEEFRRTYDVESLAITPDVFPPPRDRAPGRDFSW